MKVRNLTASRMTSNQIGEAQQRARDCMARGPERLLRLPLPLWQRGAEEEEEMVGPAGLEPATTRL